MPRLREDLIVTSALLKRWEGEAELEHGDGRHYGVILRNDGSLLVHHPGSPTASPEQLLWAANVLRLLNYEVHHDGAWVIVFTHPRTDLPNTLYRRYVLLWIDQDGDVQFPIEWVEGESEMLEFADVVAAGIGSTASKCDAAWAQWRMLMQDVLEPNAEQTFKRAQGQPRPSTRH